LAPFWYALRSHPRKEAALNEQLLASGIESYYPRLVVHPVNPRARKIAPYFPGYLFVHVNLEEVPLIVFQRTPHAVGMVTFGEEPAIVPDNLINSLQRYLADLVTHEREDKLNLKTGDPVEVLSGPFAQYPAIFDARLPGTTRVRILLKMLNSRGIRLEVDESQIRKPRSPSTLRIDNI
jgi:transcription antitermination factor NusG